MSRNAFLTPSDIPSPSIYFLEWPSSEEWEAILQGILLEGAGAGAWEKFGDADPEDCSDAVLKAIFSLKKLKMEYIQGTISNISNGTGSFGIIGGSAAIRITQAWARLESGSLGRLRFRLLGPGGLNVVIRDLLSPVSQGIPLVFEGGLILDPGWDFELGWSGASGSPSVSLFAQWEER